MFSQSTSSMVNNNQSIAPANRFIALNILPSRDKEGLSALYDLDQQLKLAIQLGFNYAWLNPICKIPAASVCHRYCLDTGVNTTLYQSLYAVENLLNVRALFSSEATKKIFQSAKQKGLNILVDFVWKHVSIDSPLVKTHPNWFGTTLKDVIEFNFHSEAALEIIGYLKKAIDLYLDPKHLGFSGLRIDAASHIPPFVREAMYTYIRNTYKDAVIFEEVLFSRAEELNIQNLVKEANEKKIFSHFVTSNIYYQKPDAFGMLPQPDQMGDKLKMQLAENNGIGFVGNHDHFSAGWCTILAMAAKRAIDDNFILSLTNLISPFKNDKTNAEKIIEKIKLLARNEKLIESIDEAELCLKLLLPFAHDISKELLNADPSQPNEILNDFTQKLLGKISDRTMVSPSGYFFLACELQSLFSTQRIFANKEKEPFQHLYLNIDDFIKHPKELEKIIEQMKKDKRYDNIKNFERSFPLYENELKNKKITKNSVEKININMLRIWFPYLIEFLRNNNFSGTELKVANDHYKQKEQDLINCLPLKDFIYQVNSIFAKLQTIGCTNYQTFTSLDKIKIIVRLAEDQTDIICLNLDLTKQYMMDALALQKIAVWLQTRLYSIDEARNATQNNRSANKLVDPFDKKPIVFVENEGWYSGYWKKNNEKEFNKSFKRIMGDQDKHTTTLYFGGKFEITEELKDSNKISIFVASSANEANLYFESNHHTFFQINPAVSQSIMQTASNKPKGP